MQGVTLDALLSSSMGLRASTALLRSATGEPLTYAQLDARADALASLLASVEAEPSSPALIATTLTPEALIAVMACLRAGLSPHLVPASITGDEAEALLTVSEAPVAIGAGPVEELRPLLALRSAAARSFHLRLLAGFGPHVPDGVAPVDQLPDAPPLPAGLRPSLAFTLPAREGAHGLAPETHTTCDEAAIMALAFEVARELCPAPSSRIVTTMSGVDAATIATSAGLGLIAGVEVTMQGLFSLAKLWGNLTSSLSVHLVAPASVASAMAQAGITRHASLASLILIHDVGASPATLTLPEEGMKATVIDIWRNADGTCLAQKR
jgi:acyl-CoA synthetase (AMP-forming)/AMP-acid ligase II